VVSYRTCSMPTSSTGPLVYLPEENHFNSRVPGLTLGLTSAAGVVFQEHVGNPARSSLIIVAMPSLESSIDGLYQGPLDGFVAARTALAKTLSGGDAQRVKRLQKPTAVPWAVNQVCWHARPVYDRLLKSGGKLRSAQIAALGGRSADVRGAADAHRTAIASAVTEALRLAASGGVHPNAEALAQAFEAVSLAITQTEPAGRLTKPLRPAGFEALAGVTVKPPAHLRLGPQAAPERPSSSVRTPPTPLPDDVRTRQREKAAAERQRSAGIKRAQRALVRTQAAEARARVEWERRKRDLDAAEQALARLRTQ
jgi:hypothetical protein